MDVVPQGASEANSIRSLRRILVAREKLVGVCRPGDREQRENRDDGQRFHDVSVDFDCGQKRQSSAHFRDQRGGTSWPPGGHFDRSTARKAISVLGRRYAEMPQERSSHAFVVAETGTFGDLHNPADLPAFKQQPRGFHA